MKNEKIKVGDRVTVDTVEKNYIYEVTVVDYEKKIASIWIELPMFGLCNSRVSLDRLTIVK